MRQDASRPEWFTRAKGRVGYIILLLNPRGCYQSGAKQYEIHILVLPLTLNSTSVAVFPREAAGCRYLLKYSH